ncbi:hypothetical protein ACP70R_045379 [Stipagrostis hirtigluma subsp. patula]
MCRIKVAHFLYFNKKNFVHSDNLEHVAEHHKDMVFGNYNKFVDTEALEHVAAHHEDMIVGHDIDMGAEQHKDIDQSLKQVSRDDKIVNYTQATTIDAINNKDVEYYKKNLHKYTKNIVYVCIRKPLTSTDLHTTTKTEKAKYDPNVSLKIIDVFIECMKNDKKDASKVFLQPKAMDFTDLFGFGVDDLGVVFTPPMVEEPTIPVELKAELAKLLPLLERPVEDLIDNSEALRDLLRQAIGLLPDELALRLNEAAYMESHRIPVAIARKREAARAAQQSAAQSIAELKVQAATEKAELDRLANHPSVISSELERLRKEEADLLRALQEKQAAIRGLEQQLADLPSQQQAQKEKLAAIVKETIKKTGAQKQVEGSAEADAAIIEKADTIRREALDALRRFLN